MHVVNPISESIIEINKQTKIIEYEQIGLSKDNVQFHLGVVIFYRVGNPLHLAYRLGIQSIETSECVKEIAIGAMRNILGENVLQTIIENRELITNRLTEELNEMLSYWGILIEICSLKCRNISM